MCKITSLILCLSMTVVSFAEITWTNGDATGNEWQKVDNWSSGVPTTSDTVVVEGGITGPLLGIGITGDAGHLYVGRDTTGASLTIDGGSLQVPNNILVGYNAGAEGQITIYPDNNYSLPDDSEPHTMDSWTLCLGEAGGIGTLVNLGGTVKVYSEWFNVAAWGGSAHVQADGGKIISEGLHMGAGGLIDITQGILMIHADYVTNPSWGDVIGGWVNGGQLTAYNGDGTIVYDYDSTNPGYTTVWAVPEPATMLILGLGGLSIVRRRK